MVKERRWNAAVLVIGAGTGRVRSTGAVLLTLPVPQSLAILQAGVEAVLAGAS